MLSTAKSLLGLPVNLIKMTGASLAAPPLHKEEGSGTALLLKLFCFPEILGNMNMQILRPQYDRDMQA